ncbi:unnamed protein product [Lupinus luteus]|uniref:Retrotransposon gag domain-containing protein n=1 Tax=Lupinus luteus TaxID=3873 RepID=A0AAV1VQV6_LUPLU
MAHSLSRTRFSQMGVQAKTTDQGWEDFKDQFSQKNAPAIYQIQSLSSLSQGTMTVSTYFTKLKGLWDGLETYQMKAHSEHREEDQMMQFLIGLNDAHNTSYQYSHDVTIA